MPDAPDRNGPTWHALPAEGVLAELNVGAGGLSDREASRRRQRYGANVLLLSRPTPWWRILAAQFKGLVIGLLAAAAVVALVMGDLPEAFAVLAVLLLNGGIGFWMEWRARQAMEALRQLQVHQAVVLRDGEPQTVDGRDLVPGDVVLLEAGTAVPADARLLAAHDMTVVEAPLTGESAPVRKTTEPVEDPDTPLAERTSMVYKGTLVAAGDGKAVVVATGRDTEVGRVTELVAETEAEETPLERRLDRLGRRLVWVTLAVAAVVTAVGVLRGEPLWRMVETGIALAVAAVPEGLPVVATLALAVGMGRMAKRHALVRRLPAVETLGSATVICTDKTGTLTAGEMTAVRLLVGGEEVEVTGGGYGAGGELLCDGEPATLDPVSRNCPPGLAEALAAAVLPNRAVVRRDDDGGDPAVTGDPTEAALLVLGEKAGRSRETLLAERPRVAEVPFSSERMWMATFHELPDGDGGAGRVVYVKGAPDRVLDLSTEVVRADGRVPLDDAARRALEEENHALAEAGLRVLALACRHLDAGEETGETAVRDLTFLGFAGLSDPPAPGVAVAVERFHRAGVRTVMITGDQAVTARAIAEELGVLRPGDEVVGGRELAALSDAELDEVVARAAVFSRASPEGKLRIIDALQRRGEIVAMLGDGVNDAPALKSADIGVAMGGRGTDVAKETAAVVLQDDRFETIAAAVEEGRVIFDNIRKFIFYLFSCNLAEVLVLFVAGVAGWPLPLTALQILWLNLLTDVFPALALAVEPAEPDVMDRGPRDPTAGVMTAGFLGLVGGYGALITAATLGVFLWGLATGPTPRAVTLAFVTLAFAQLFHVVNARSPQPLLWSRRFFSNRWVGGAFVLTAGLQLAAVYAPGLGSLLDTVPLGWSDWGVVLGAVVVPVVVGQVGKAVAGRWRGGGSAA